jgi:hypothetical protein
MAGDDFIEIGTFSQMRSCLKCGRHGRDYDESREPVEALSGKSPVPARLRQLAADVAEEWRSERSSSYC